MEVFQNCLLLMFSSIIKDSILSEYFFLDIRSSSTTLSLKVLYLAQYCKFDVFLFFFMITFSFSNKIFNLTCYPWASDCLITTTLFGMD